MATLDRTAEKMTDEDIVQVDMTVSKILVPTDGSATAVEATKVAISMAKRFGADVVALFVGPGHIEDPIEYASQEEMEGVHHSVAGLDVARRLGECNGVMVHQASSQGAVAHEILRVAEEQECGMIVIGSSGRSGFKRLALGSVAASVMNEAHVPVLVVRNCTTEFCMTPRG